MTAQVAKQLLAVEVDTGEVSKLLDRLEELAAAADADGPTRRLTEKDGETLKAAADLAMTVLEAGEPDVTHALSDLTVVRFARLDHDFGRAVDIDALLEAAESLAGRVEHSRPSEDAIREINAANAEARRLSKELADVRQAVATAARHVAAAAEIVDGPTCPKARRNLASLHLRDARSTLARFTPKE